jgi:hypothetical protein
MEAAMKTSSWIVLPVALLLAAPAAAAEPQFTFKPVVIDSKNASGATVGLEYKYERQWKAAGGSDDTGKPTFDFENVKIWDRVGELRAQGTIAAARERNPHKLLDLAGNYRYDYSAGPWVAGAGATLKAETDQSFDKRQFVYGLQARGFVNNPLGGNGWALAYLNFGRVDPAADADRKAALGGAKLSAFNRWDIEAIWHYDLKGGIGSMAPRSLEFQLRHFQEISPPPAIERASLDQQRLVTVRLNFSDDKFIAWSRGKLPFDRQSDRAVKIGWTYQFE